MLGPYLLVFLLGLDTSDPPSTLTPRKNTLRILRHTAAQALSAGDTLEDDLGSTWQLVARGSRVLSIESICQRSLSPLQHS